MYTDENRSSDFQYFVSNFDDLFRQYGRCYIAIKDRQVLGSFPSIDAAIDALSPFYELGTYIIQKCFGDESSYTAKIYGLAKRRQPAGL